VCLIHIFNVEVCIVYVLIIALTNDWVEWLLPLRMSISTFDLLLNHTFIIRIEQSSHPTYIQSIIVPHSCCLVNRCLLTEDHVLLVLILVTVIIITLGHVHHVVAFEGFVYAFVQSLYFLLWDCHLLCYLLMIAMVCVL
jgi:uncharacterized membrane protein